MNRIAQVFVGVVLGTVLTVGTAAAETAELMKVNLPYDVVVGKTTLHAGEYTISDLQNNSGSSVLEIQSSGGGTVTAIFQHISQSSGATSSGAKVILRHAGSSYGIDQIWLSGGEQGYELLSAQVGERTAK